MIKIAVIEEIRATAKITRRQLAARCGVDVATVWRWEKEPRGGIVGMPPNYAWERLNRISTEAGAEPICPPYPTPERLISDLIEGAG